MPSSLAPLTEGLRGGQQAAAFATGGAVDGPRSLTGMEGAAGMAAAPPRPSASGGSAADMLLLALASNRASKRRMQHSATSVVEGGGTPPRASLRGAPSAPPPLHFPTPLRCELTSAAAMSSGAAGCAPLLSTGSHGSNGGTPSLPLSPSVLSPSGGAHLSLNGSTSRLGRKARADQADATSPRGGAALSPAGSLTLPRDTDLSSGGGAVPPTSPRGVAAALAGRGGAAAARQSGGTGGGGASRLTLECSRDASSPLPASQPPAGLEGSSPAAALSAQATLARGLRSLPTSPVTLARGSSARTTPRAAAGPSPSLGAGLLSLMFGRTSLVPPAAAERPTRSVTFLGAPSSVPTDGGGVRSALGRLRTSLRLRMGSGRADAVSTALAAAAAAASAAPPGQGARAGAAKGGEDRFELVIEPNSHSSDGEGGSTAAGRARGTRGTRARLARASTSELPRLAPPILASERGTSAAPTPRRGVAFSHGGASPPAPSGAATDRAGQLDLTATAARGRRASMPFEPGRLPRRDALASVDLSRSVCAGRPVARVRTSRTLTSVGGSPLPLTQLSLPSPGMRRGGSTASAPIVVPPRRATATSLVRHNHEW